MNTGKMRLRVPLLAVMLTLAIALGGAAAAFAAGDASGAGAGNAGAVPALSAPGPLAVAAAGTAEPEQSEGGSVVGILLDNTAAGSEDPDAPDVGDSYLGILLAPGEGELVSVTYMLVEGVEYTRDSVVPGWTAAAPKDPAWPAGRPWPGGFAGEPVFTGWCTKNDAGVLVPYDFSTPVLADLTLWAAWADGGRAEVTVTLDAGEGGLVADPADPAAAPGRTLELRLRPGAAYPALPTPVRTGYGFAGWYDAQTGGGLVYPTPGGASPATVPEGGCTLWAHWEAKAYWVHYVIDQAAGTSYDQKVSYDENGSARFMTWEALADLGYAAPQNRKLLGWHTDPAGDDSGGAFYGAGNPLPDLAQAAPAGSLNVYAQWQGEFADGEFDVRFVYGDGATEDGLLEGVPAGTLVEPFDDPKRAGYQFAGWWLRANDRPDGALVRQWRFDEAVHSDLVLFAKWDLRLDVTVPVSVGFAVDATTGETKGPDAGKYALKSRTVRPVSVKAFEAVSEQEELESFFGLAEGVGWEDTLADTALSLKSAGAAEAVVLPLAGVREGATWKSVHAVADAEKGAWTLGAFSYAGTPFDELWQGGDPSEQLPIEFGLELSGLLEARTDLDGARPITHLIVTVSAQG